MKTATAFVALGSVDHERRNCVRPIARRGCHVEKAAFCCTNGAGLAKGWQRRAKCIAPHARTLRATCTESLVSLVQMKSRAGRFDGGALTPHHVGTRRQHIGEGRLQSTRWLLQPLALATERVVASRAWWRRARTLFRAPDASTSSTTIWTTPASPRSRSPSTAIRTAPCPASPARRTWTPCSSS